MFSVWIKRGESWPESGLKSPLPSSKSNEARHYLYWDFELASFDFELGKGEFRPDSGQDSPLLIQTENIDKF